MKASLLRNKLKGLSTLLALCLLAALFICWTADFRLNLTASMPKGIYRITDGGFERGDQVELCLEGAFAELALERGYLRTGRCENGIMPLVKTLAGLPGDAFAIERDGITVNGALLPESAIRAFDNKGRRMPVQLQSGVIPQGKALVLSAHEGGFDGRYFGLVDMDKLKKVEPLITF